MAQVGIGDFLYDELLERVMHFPLGVVRFETALAVCRREARLAALWYTGAMARSFKTVDYAAALDTSVRLRDCLPPDHLACFVADIITQLDLAPFYSPLRRPRRRTLCP